MPCLDSSDPGTYKFLPDEIEIKKAPRQWIINVINTIVQDDFSNWVRQYIETRNKKVVTSHNILIDMDPAVAEAFAASTAVSSK